MKHLHHVFFICFVSLLLVVVSIGLISCEQHLHTGEEKWTANKRGHWHAATCEHSNEMLDYDKHEWGITRYLPATEEEERTCIICEYVDHEKHEHSYTKWQQDSEEHWKRTTCKIHAAVNVERGLHKWSDPIVVETGTGTLKYHECTVCGIKARI